MWWDEYEEGDVLAVEDRDTFAQPWPGNKRFVLFIDEDRLALFSEEGIPVNEPDDTPDGLVTMGAWQNEFASNTGDYYCIPPSSSCENESVIPDFSAAYTAELDAAKLDSNIGWLPPRDDEDLGDAVCCIRLCTVPQLATLASYWPPQTIHFGSGLLSASQSTGSEAEMSPRGRQFCTQVTHRPSPTAMQPLYLASGWRELG